MSLQKRADQVVEFFELVLKGHGPGQFPCGITDIVQVGFAACVEDRHQPVLDGFRASRFAPSATLGRKIFKQLSWAGCEEKLLVTQGSVPRQRAWPLHQNGLDAGELDFAVVVGRVA